MTPIYRGSPWQRRVFCEAGALHSQPVSALQASCTTLQLTVPQHGLPSCWRVALHGCRQLLPGWMARCHPPAAHEYHLATVQDADTLQLRNPDGRSMPAYRGGAAILYRPPLDLQGVQASLLLRNLQTGFHWQGALAKSTSPGVLDLQLTASDSLHWPLGPLRVLLQLQWPGGQQRLLRLHDVNVEEGA